jgi:DNA-binding MarR family transcriptional regulator
MPSKNPTTHKQTVTNLISSILRETRAATLFVHTISEITGMHATDIKCLDFLNEVRLTTAGKLAKITGLTTGAITSVIDRLESAGFIIRETDKNDRRKTMVRLIVDHPDHLKPARNIFKQKIPEILSGYTTKEIKIITEWNTKLATTFHEEIEKLKNKNKK